MRSFLILSIVIAACAANVLKDPTLGFKNGDRYFFFPGDGDDTYHLVDTLEGVDQRYIDNYRNSENNQYWLYTIFNPTTPQMLYINDVNSVLDSNFDPSKVTVVIAHGWNGNGANTMNKMLIEAFLTNDVNVIVLDWSIMANRNYFTAFNGVPAVGMELGKFLNWLVTLGATYEKMHLVGFSLGGHVVGNAGWETASQVQRITALDPAGPFWGSNRNRLTEKDGKYVEVIHTNTNLLGYTDPCGHADFYPNGGGSMPGCITNSCSHSRAYEYMAASVKYNHLLANRCDSMTDVRRNKCNGELYEMGDTSLHKELSGIFRVNTGRNYPY